MGSIYCVHTSSSAIVKEVGVEEKEDKISDVVGRGVFRQDRLAGRGTAGPKNSSAGKIMQKKKDSECAFLWSRVLTVVSRNSQLFALKYAFSLLN